MKFISVQYSCSLCGIKNKAVDVPERTTEEIDVWFEDVLIVHLCADHRKHSPDCNPENLSEVMIPMPENADKIGQAEPSKH